MRARGEDAEHGGHGTRRLVVLIACTGLLLAFSAESAFAAPSVTASNVTAVEGASFTVATFTDGPMLTCLTGYSVTVTWDDGGPSGPVSVVPTPNVASCSVVVGPRVEPFDEGAGMFHVVVTGLLGASSPTTATANVADAPITSAGAQLSATAGVALTATVATITDPDPNAAMAVYKASIGWGDGTSTNAPTITPKGGGLAIIATHTYDRPGSFATALTISEDGGSTSATSGTVTVAAPGPAPAAPRANPPGTGAPPLVDVSAPRMINASTLSLRLTCPASAPRCRGVARVITLAASAQRPPLRGGTALGRALFILAPGESQTVVVPVARRLRLPLRRLRAARLAGVAIAFGAGGHSAAATGPSAVIDTTSLR